MRCYGSLNTGFLASVFFLFSFVFSGCFTDAMSALQLASSPGPVSINGIGIRESVLVVLFGGLGIAKTETLAVAWLVYGVGLLQGLIGGIVYSFRK